VHLILHKNRVVVNVFGERNLQLLKLKHLNLNKNDL